MRNTTASASKSSFGRACSRAVWLCALTLATLMTLSGEARAGATIPDADERWFVVETAHFRVLSNAPARRAESVARELEALHALLSRIAAEERLGPKTQVYALRTSDDFAAYSPWPERRGVAGFFTTGLLRNYIAIDLSAGAASRAVYHEYLHEFAATNFPGVPLWFNEGLAEYYSTFELGARDAQIGRPVEQHLYWLSNSKPIPLADLFAVNTSSEEYHESRRAGSFYAQSWAIVHYLLSSNERIGQVATFLTELNEGADLEVAFQRGFDQTFEELEREVDLYARRGEFPFLRAPLDWFPDTGLKSRRADHVTVLTLLGELLAVQPTRAEDAVRHFSTALHTSDEQSPLALAGLGWIAWQRGDQDGALEQLREATRLSSAAEPRLYLGLLLLDRLLRDPDAAVVQGGHGGQGAQDSAGGALGTPALAREAQQALHDALAREPNWPRALVGLGLTYLFVGDAKEGIEVLNRALAVRPADPLVGFGLTSLAARLGAFDIAWERSEQLAELLDRTPERERHAALHPAARNTVATLQVNRSIDLWNGGSWEEAMALLNDLAARLDGLEFRHFQSTIEGLQAAEVDRAAGALYNRAVQMARGGETAAALELVLEVLRTPNLDPQLRNQAREAADQLRQLLAAHDG